MLIKKIIETKNVSDYLKKRNLIKQYKKAKNYLLDWKFNVVNFKLREPKKEWVFYFRISKQYRAWWYLDWDILKIYKIDDHQN